MDNHIDRRQEFFNRLMPVALISTALLVLMVLRTPQGLYSDPAWQMKALQQYLSGESPSINHLVTARPGDLSRDVAGWISWWPPGTQLLAYPLRANGIALGDAIRIIAVISIFVGTIGWIRWFSLFHLKWWIMIILATFLPWMRYVSNALFLYSAETLVYASAPWILLSTYNLGKTWAQRGRSYRGMLILFAFFGFCLGIGYMLKYAIFVVSLGSLVYLGLRMFRQRSYNSAQTAMCFVLAVVFFATPTIILNLLNYKLGNLMNPFMARIGLNLHWQNFLYILSNPALALADANAFLSYVLLHPEHGIAENPLWLGFIGLPGGLLLLWLILRPRIFDNPKRLAVSLFLINGISLFIVWSFSRAAAGYRARYFASASIAVLPLVIQEGFRLWRNNRRLILRTVLAGAGIAYIAIPLVYGGVSVIGKVIRTPADYKVGPSHVYNPLLANIDLAGVRSRLMQDFSPHTDIWYFTSPVTALDFPGRAIITHADFEPLDDLQKKKYRSASPLRVYALLPPHFEKNGKGEAIRKSFIQADRWEKRKVEGCNYVLWTTGLEVWPQSR